MLTEYEWRNDDIDPGRVPANVVQGRYVVSMDRSQNTKQS